MKVGQFGQDEYWNIYDMSPYDSVRPNYVREWLRDKKEKWKQMMEDRIRAARAQGIIPEEEKLEVKVSTKDMLKKYGISTSGRDELSMGDLSIEGGSAGDPDLEGFDVDHFESDEDEFDKYKGIELYELDNTTTTRRARRTRDEENAILDAQLKRKPPIDIEEIRSRYKVQKVKVQKIRQMKDKSDEF